MRWVSRLARPHYLILFRQHDNILGESDKCGVGTKIDVGDESTDLSRGAMWSRITLNQGQGWVLWQIFGGLNLAVGASARYTFMELPF